MCAPIALPALGGIGLAAKLLKKKSSSSNSAQQTQQPMQTQGTTGPSPSTAGYGY